MGNTKWETPIVKNCDKLVELPTLIVPVKVWGTIIDIVSKETNEFVLYLKAKEKDGDYTIKSIWVPKQTKKKSSVDVKEHPTPKKGEIWGILHLHPWTGSNVGFSGVDDDGINKNNDFSIVVNKDLAYEAVVRLMLPCGSFAIKETKVVVMYPKDKEVIKDYETNAVEEAVKPTPKSWWERNKEMKVNWQTGFTNHDEYEPPGIWGDSYYDSTIPSERPQLPSKPLEDNDIRKEYCHSCKSLTMQSRKGQCLVCSTTGSVAMVCVKCRTIRVWDATADVKEKCPDCDKLGMLAPTKVIMQKFGQLGIKYSFERTLHDNQEEPQGEGPSFRGGEGI